MNEAGNPLTSRQQEILQYRSEGLSTATIAGMFGVSDSVITNEIEETYPVLGASRPTSAVCSAIRLGFIHGPFKWHPAPSHEITETDIQILDMLESGHIMEEIAPEVGMSVTSATERVEYLRYAFNTGTPTGVAACYTKWCLYG